MHGSYSVQCSLIVYIPERQLLMGNMSSKFSETVNSDPSRNACCQPTTNINLTEDFRQPHLVFGDIQMN